MSEQVGPTTTEVEIFGGSYVIRGEQQPAYLTDLATEVDRRMRELAEHVISPEPGRLAILTALNLADELSRNRSVWEGERNAIEARVLELGDLLDRALGREKSGRKRSRATSKNESRGTP